MKFSEDIWRKATHKQLFLVMLLCADIIVVFLFVCFVGNKWKTSCENVPSGAHTKKQGQMEQRDPDHEKVCPIFLYIFQLIFMLLRRFTVISCYHNDANYSQLNCRHTRTSSRHCTVAVDDCEQSVQPSLNSNVVLTLSHSGWITSMSWQLEMSRRKCGT